MGKSFLFLMLSILLGGCVGALKAQKLKELIQITDSKIQINSPAKDSLLVQYLGCGGFFIKKSNQAILVDPFFSNIGPISGLLFKRLETDTAQIDSFFYQHFDTLKDKKGLIKAILVGHSHYDHLYDVPYIFNNHLNQDSTKIMGSLSTKHLLKTAQIENAAGQQTVVDLTALAWKPFQKINYVYTQNRQIRILPIISEHAPHVLGIKLLKKGPVEKDISTYPENVFKFREGTNFSFLIDFLNQEEEIEFRIFVQSSSASTPPLGFPPEMILKEKPVDLMLLCVASFNQVKYYPQEIIKHIKPKHIILAHWENFFQKRAKLILKPSAVPGTSVKKFLKKFQEITKELSSPPEWTLPNVNTTIEIFY